MNIKKSFVPAIVFFALVLTMMFSSVSVVHAAMADEAVDYVWGKTAKETGEGINRYYRIRLDKEKHVEFVFSNNNRSENDHYDYYGNALYIMVKNESGDDVIKDGLVNVGYKTNKATGIHTTNFSTDLASGLYYVQVYLGERVTTTTYWLDIATENIKTMPKGVLASTSSPSSGKLKLTAQQTKGAMGYTFEYSKDYTFKEGTITTNTDKNTLTVDGLADGDVYYVHVRPYTLYDDGAEVYGQYSSMKKVTIGDKGSGETAPTIGEKFIRGDAIYVLLSNKTLDYISPVNSTKKTVTVPDTVTVAGKSYKVSTIHDGAFLYNTKITNLTIGANVQTIGKMACYKCSKLKNLKIKSKSLKKAKIGVDAFTGTPDNMNVTIPKGKTKSYKTILTAKGASKNISVKEGTWCLNNGADCLI